MSYLLINDELKKASEHELLLNRGFLYGDGFFETMRVYDGMPLWLDLHQERIEMTLKNLKMKRSPFLEPRRFSRLIWDLIEANEVTNGRLRLNVFRDADGYYMPTANDVMIVAKAEQLDMPLYHLNIDGLYVDIAEQVEIHANYLNSVKSLGCQTQIMAAIEAKERGLDDLLIRNSKDNIAEAISSNIYLIRGNEAITPPMTEGAVFGIMRAVIQKRLPQIGLDLVIRPLTLADFTDAEEIWLTNSIKGIQWVAGLRKKRYYSDKAKLMTEVLQKSVV